MLVTPFLLVPRPVVNNHNSAFGVSKPRYRVAWFAMARVFRPSSHGFLSSLVWGMAKIQRLGDAPLQLSAPSTVHGPSTIVTVTYLAKFQPPNHLPALPAPSEQNQ